MTPPVLIVTYARSLGLIRIIEICVSAGVKKIYVAVDGPSSDLSKNEQKAMKNFLSGAENKFDIHLKVWWRTSNLGPAVSVLTAIKWFFKSESEGVILEDDLIPDTSFFAFAKEGLERYRSNEEIWIIAGSRLIDPDSQKNETSWSKYPMTWGWATWSSKWESMQKELLSNSKPPIRNLFNRRANFWDTGSKRSRLGFIDAWDLPLASAQFRMNKFTLIPPVNLIRNIGFDLQATHTFANIYPLDIQTYSLPNEFNFQNQPENKISLQYDLQLDRKVYSIRFRHTLLRILSPFKDKLMLKRIYNESLAHRVAKVELP